VPAGVRVSSSACAYAPASAPMVARLMMPSRGADDALPGEMLTGLRPMLVAHSGYM